MRETEQLSGFIKLYRKLVSWGWYRDSVVKDVFLHLLLTASFKDSAWQGRTIQKGQVVTSYKHLAEDLGFGVRQVRTALEKLRSTGEVACESTNKYTVVTVVNWSDYQYLGRNETGKSTNGRQALSVTELLQSLDDIKNKTSKSTSKDNEQRSIDSVIEEIKEKILTKSLTNERQTTDIQPTNNRQHRKNVKNVKEGKEIDARVRAEKIAQLRK